MDPEKVFKALLDFSVRESLISLYVMDVGKLRNHTLEILQGMCSIAATRDEVIGQSYTFQRDLTISRIVELWFPCLFHMIQPAVKDIDIHDKIEEILMTSC